MPRSARNLSAAIFATALIVGCSPQVDNPAEATRQQNSSTADATISPAENAATPTADNAADSGFPARHDAYTAKLKGKYTIAEDFEGGRACKIELTDGPTIGGYAVNADEACLAKLGILDPFAWFVAPDDGWLVLIDPQRKVLLRLKPVPNGSFYAAREDQQLENILLAPA